MQDLGAGAVTFPSSANPEDLALLLAAPPRRVDDHHGRAVGDDGRSSSTAGAPGSNASTFLTRLQTGGRVVDGRVVAALHRNRISGWVVLLLLLSRPRRRWSAALLVSPTGDGVLAWVQQGVAVAIELVRGGVR